MHYDKHAIDQATGWLWRRYLLAQAKLFLRASVNENATVLSISNMDNQK